MYCAAHQVGFTFFMLPIVYKIEIRKILLIKMSESKHVCLIKILRTKN